MTSPMTSLAGVAGACVQGGSLLAMTLVLILRHDHVTLYIGTALFGLFLSSITPTALSLAENYLELSGR